MHVEARFGSLLKNLGITQIQFEDGFGKQEAIRSHLNEHYYGYPSATANSLITGSWAKQLRVRPVRDVDVLFVLPWSVYWRFETRLGNRQSQILQEVKAVLDQRYQETRMRGDGQAVIVDFWSMPIEVVPAFRFDNGQFWICDTHYGGRYIVTDPVAEIATLNAIDFDTGGVARNLIRMMKQWQRHCAVPLRSHFIERMVSEFLHSWHHDPRSFWYDWMVRDFFEYAISRAGGWVTMPGTGENQFIGDGWLSRAHTGLAHSKKAASHESFNNNEAAGEEWQRVFGSMIPKTV